LAAASWRRDSRGDLASGMIDLKRYSALLPTGGLTTVDEVTSVGSFES